MPNAYHTLKLYPFINFRDILELKERELIGEVKRGLLDGKLLVFSNDLETNGFVIRHQGDVHARLLRPSILSEDVLKITAKNAAHTLYKALPVRVDLDPLYPEKEL